MSNLQDPTATPAGGWVNKTSLPREILSQLQFADLLKLTGMYVKTILIPGEHSFSHENVDALFPHMQY